MTVVFIIVLLFLPLDRRVLILVTVTLINVVSVMGTAPVMANHLDFGGQYAGVLLGITNSIGSIASFLLPAITGYVIRDDYVRRSAPFLSSTCKVFSRKATGTLSLAFC